MADSDLTLLTEHFGWPPVSLLDDVINSVNQLADRALASVEELLRGMPPQGLGFKPKPAAPPPSSRPSRSSRGHNASSSTDNPTDGSSSSSTGLSAEEAANHEIENGTHQLETLLLTSIDRNFDKFELYVMRNILCIRPSEPRDWIRLGHYDGLDLEAEYPPMDAVAAGAQEDGRTESGDGGGGKPSLNSVRRLRKKLQASQQLNAMLHAERARNEALLQALRGMVGGPPSAEKKAAGDGGKLVVPVPTKMEVEGEQVDFSGVGAKPALGFLHDTGGLEAGAADKPLETTTAFTLSQLQALRALSTSLRSIMPSLEAGKDGEEEDDGGRKSWRRQRTEYVETATKKHLEHARGLELGNDGEVRDGEWQGEGRRLAADEVDSLEKAAALLGAAGPAGSSREDAMDES